MAQTQSEVHEIMQGMYAAHVGSGNGHELNQAEQRQEWRRPLDARCELCTFHGSGHQLRTQGARTRNLTFAGISLVVDLRNAIPRDRPAEVVVHLPGGDETHVAGVVAFCRKIESERFELGVDVKAVAENPILTRDVDHATRIYDWFADALAVPV